MSDKPAVGRVAFGPAKRPDGMKNLADMVNGPAEREKRLRGLLREARCCVNYTLKQADAMMSTTAAPLANLLRRIDEELGGQP